MFKVIEIGAWYRFRFEDKSTLGQVVDRRGNSYTFRFTDEQGEARTARVPRSSIMGRLGEHIVASLESSSSPADQACPAIASGDWHLFQNGSEMPAGLVYRIQGERLTLFFFDRGIPRFVTIDRSQLGPREDRLSSHFKRQMERTAGFLEDWVAAVSKSGKQEEG